MLRKYAMLAGFCLFGFVFSNAFGQDWRFSIGVNYRTFDDIEFKRVDFVNPAFQTSTNGQRYVNGRFEESGTAAPDRFTVGDGVVQAPAFVAANGQPLPGQHDGEIFLDRAGFNGASEDTDDAWGIILGAHRTIDESSNIQWNLDWWFSTATSSDDESYGRRSTQDTFDVQDGFATSQTEIFSGTTIGPTSASGSTLSQNAIDFDYDIEAYTLSAGISGTHRHDRFGLTLGMGPSVTIGDIDIDRIRRSSGSSLPTPVVVRDSDSEDEFIFGIYGNLGVQFDLSETIGIAVDYRYDWGFSDLSTKLGEVELDGSSANVRLVFMY